jgi:PAS domain-containing protein
MAKSAFSGDVSLAIKRAEIALFAKKERLAVTLQSIGDAVITTDTDGHVGLMNKVAEQRLHHVLPDDGRFAFSGPGRAPRRFLGVTSRPAGRPGALV